MTDVYLVLIGILALSGLMMSASKLAFRKLPAENKLHDRRNPDKMQGAAYRRSTIVNSLWSTGMMFGFLALFGERLIYTTDEPLWRVVAVALATLLVYDFLYYFLHRDLLHRVGPLIKVHAVHHTGKFPTAPDALYIHPVETILGVAVLLGCMAAAGPMHIGSFAIVFFLHTQLNIIIHSGLTFRSFPLNMLGYMAGKHDIHHKSMRSGNYASITPLPDLLFGTLDGHGKPAG